MNLTELHNTENTLSAKQLFKSEEGVTVAIHLKKGGVLKEHITKVPALLLCVKGKIIYDDENDNRIELSSGNYIEIEPMVKHWLECVENSEAVLMK